MIEHQRSADVPPGASPQMGEAFGRYRLLGLLGQGGMGRLYIAERRGVHGFVKIVALKRILPHLAGSPQLRDMFLNEARTAARLEHPNIVATYELGEVDGTYFISMEYLPGEDLSAVISRCQGPHTMPVEMAVAVAQQAAQGLQYAHDARDGQGRLVGLVHRDVSPRNLFVTYHGVVKLLDFGMVRTPTGPKSVPGIFKGKYGYCAPEQLESGRIDSRTDVFCLGIVLWECLTGVRLFDGATDTETIGAVRSRPIDPPSVLRPELPAALDRIALRALARDPGGRFQSAQEMSDELDRFLLGRNNRPSTKSVGQWIEGLFGAERASLKKSMSQGDNAEGALQRLNALEGTRPSPATVERSSNRAAAGPRALWSTGVGAPPSGVNVRDLAPAGRGPSSSPARPPAAVKPAEAPAVRATPSPWRRMVLLGTSVAVAALGGLVAVSVRGSGATASVATAPTTASLELHSHPEGATIFVDGRPTGLETPATLRGIVVGQSVKLRIVLEGYRAATREATPASGQAQTLSFTLEPVPGRIQP